MKIKREIITVIAFVGLVVVVLGIIAGIRIVGEGTRTVPRAQTTGLPTCFLVGPTCVAQNTPVTFTAGCTNCSSLGIYRTQAPAEWLPVAVAPNCVPGNCVGETSFNSTGTYEVVCNAFEKANYDTTGKKCSGNPWCTYNPSPRTPSFECKEWTDCTSHDRITVKVGSCPSVTEPPTPGYPSPTYSYPTREPTPNLNNYPPTCQVYGPTQSCADQNKADRYTAYCQDPEGRMRKMGIYWTPYGQQSWGTIAACDPATSICNPNSVAGSIVWKPGKYTVTVNGWDQDGAKCSGNFAATTGYADCDLYRDLLTVDVLTSCPLTEPPTPTSAGYFPSRTPTPSIRLITRTPTPTSYSLSGNLLKNPGFEADGNNNGRPDYWTDISYFTRSSTINHTINGKFSGKISSTNSTNPNFYIQQRVNYLKAGISYSYSGWIYIPSTSDSFTITPQIIWKNSGGSTIRTDTITYTRKTGAWFSFSNSKQAPANTSYALVRIKVESLNATVYIDDFSFK